MIDLIKWDKRFMEMAKLIASWSKDPSTKCGAVITDPNKRIISMGFNGFPAGTSDNMDLYQDRKRKYRRVIHAEKNAILFAKQDLSNCKIYVWPMPPCAQCAAAIIQSGIKTVVSVKCDIDKTSRWGDDFQEAIKMYKESRVEYMEMTLKQEKKMGTNYYLIDKERDEEYHLGKSSAGWCFALHVSPEENIHDLSDILNKIKQPSKHIINEYGDKITTTEFLEIVTERAWKNNADNITDLFLKENQAETGPNNLLRSKIDNVHCIGHGAGTYDFIIGVFK